VIPVALVAAALFSAPEIPKDGGYAVQEIRDGSPCRSVPE